MYYHQVDLYKYKIAEILYQFKADHITLSDACLFFCSARYDNYFQDLCGLKKREKIPLKVCKIIRESTGKKMRYKTPEVLFVLLTQAPQRDKAFWLCSQ